MRGFPPFFLLVAGILGITKGHVVNTDHHDGSRALSSMHDSNDFDMFHRRPDAQPGRQRCGMCTQLILNPVVVVLLVTDGLASAGDLNPAVLEAAGISPVAIIIRIILVYTDNTAPDPSQQQSLLLEVVVEPGDWNEETCSYLEEDCVIFQSDGILMFAPDAPGGFATLSLDALTHFNSDSDIHILSNTCDVRCKDTDVCNALNSSLEPTGTGVLLGSPVQSTFNDGFCNPSIFDDPRVTGLRGQRYDWCGEDGGWYAFLSTQDQLQMNLRVTSHLPETFPERQLVTGVAVVTEGGHTIEVEIADPLDLAPTFQETTSAGATSAPCLVNGGLRVRVDGREMAGAGDFYFRGGIHISAVNLPLECQQFGDYLMWEDLDEEQKLLHPTRRNLRTQDGSTVVVTSIFEWILADSVMIAPPWCVKYLDELDGDFTALAELQSDYAVLRIESPNLSLRVSVGMNNEQEKTLQDGRVVPATSFWQMDVRVENAEGIATAKGMLGETARPVHDKQTGKAVMSGLRVLRGEIEDYKVVHPLGTEFKQLFVPEG